MVAGVCRRARLAPGRDGGHRARGSTRPRRGGNRRSRSSFRVSGGGGRLTVAPLQDVVEEARRILDAAADIPLRALGGAAIALSTDRDLLLPREYKDIDFVTAAGRGPEVVRTFDELGYAGDQRFNGLNGHRRLLFDDTGNERQVDVFVNKFEMCHVIPLAKRLTLR